MRCSPSGTGCSSTGPPRGHKPCQQTCSSTGFSLHGSAGPATSLLQRGLPTGSQHPSSIPLLQRGVPSMGYRWISAPPWTSTGCRGTACLTVVFSTGCVVISALVPGPPPPPPSALTLVSADLFLSHSLNSSLLWLLFLHQVPPTHTLLKYVIPEALPPLIMALASGGSILKPTGTGSIKHRGSFLQLLTEPL